jgi:ribonucleoside-diphosphate reductase beta chain
VNYVQTKPKQLFNPDSIENLKIFGGDTSGIIELSDVPKRDEIYHKLVDTAYANAWLPHKVDMSGDKHDYKYKITTDEREAYDDLISFLSFLDSIQINNIPRLMEYITNPHVIYWLTRQAFDEAIHSKSYGWVFSSILDKEKASELYRKWQKNDLLLQRNKFIANIYQDFVDNPNILSFTKSILGNYALEGIYFYNGFQFFHTLANRGVMSNTQSQIAYIQRDELVHVTAFENILHHHFQDYPELLKEKQMFIDQFAESVEWEIKFSSETIGDKILGMNKTTITDYAHFLGNEKLKAIGFEEIFPKAKNPYKHLEKIAADKDETSNRTNNFEGTSKNYKNPAVIDGWEDI